MPNGWRTSAAERSCADSGHVLRYWILSVRQDCSPHLAHIGLALRVNRTNLPPLVRLVMYRCVVDDSLIASGKDTRAPPFTRAQCARDEERG